MTNDAIEELIAEKEALAERCKKHASDRVEYMEAWAAWLEAHREDDTATWLAAYSAAQPAPCPDGIELVERVLREIEKRCDDGAREILALRAQLAALQATYEAQAISGGDIVKMTISLSSVFLYEDADNVAYLGAEIAKEMIHCYTKHAAKNQNAD